LYQRLEKERAVAATWQNTIEDRLLISESISVGEDEKLLLINQLKQENKTLKARLGFNNEEDIKQHKAHAMDINEQFGTGLFNNLQFILMDADLNNDDILKLKIKDKNDELFNVVLVKASAEKKEEEQEQKQDAANLDDIVKPIQVQQKNVMNRLQDINSVIDNYDDRILRILSMLQHIKNSRKLLEWNAIQSEAKGQKGQFDLVVSELREINVESVSSPSAVRSKHITFQTPVDQRQQRTMRKFMNKPTVNLAGRNRTESMESLDSVFDLSHDDSLSRFGHSYQDDEKGHGLQQSVDMYGRISVYNRFNTPAYPQSHHNASNSTAQKEQEEAASKLTKDDVGKIFAYYDKNGDGSISVRELIEVFKQLGVDVNNTEKMDAIIASLDVDSDGIVTKENFVNWWFSSANFAEFDSAVRSLLFLYGMNFVAQRSDELHAFAQYLNRIFKDENDQIIDSVLERYLPIDIGDGGHDILSKLVDGVLLAKLINFAAPNTIDERVIHYRDIRSDTIQPKQIIENLNIVISSLKAIGVNFGSNIEASSISVEKFLDPSKYEDIIRQILSELSKIHLSRKMNLKDNPVLIRLAEIYEDDATIRSLTSEDWLKRWVNYQLKRSGEDMKIKNFGKDFRDGTVLSHVLHSVTRRKKKKIERFDVNKAFEKPTYARPGYIIEVLQQQFNVRTFLSANDILSGNSRLIKLLCVQIFNKFNGMRKITKQEVEQVNEIYKEDEDESQQGGLNGASSPTQVIINKYNPSKSAVQFAEAKHTHNKYKKGGWDTTKGRKKAGSGDKPHSLSLMRKKGNDHKSSGSLHNSKDETVTEDEEKKDEVEDAVERDIRKEKDIVNWMNEIFSASKLVDERTNKVLKINNITKDLRDGLVLLYFINLMESELVDWSRVNKQSKSDEKLTRLQCTSNCHYVISLIKTEPISNSFFHVESFPNDGNDIYNGNKDLMFKLCQNLINHHYICTLSDLLGHKVSEYDILHWTNEQLKKKLKYPRFCSFEEKKLHQFNDNSLKSCLYYIDLLLILMDDPKNDIDRDIVVHKNNRQFPDDDYTKSECLSNARYALSIARKFGGIFYISPHDLVNVESPEITMAFVMCIVVLIVTKQQKNRGKHTKNKSSSSKFSKNKPETAKQDEIVDALQIHLEQQNEIASNAESMNEDDINENEHIAAEHGRKRSVLQDYGIITNYNALEELQTLSRQYSSPNIVTPTVK